MGIAFYSTLAFLIRLGPKNVTGLYGKTQRIHLLELHKCYTQADNINSVRICTHVVVRTYTHSVILNHPSDCKPVF